jgi:hypothetical protein
VGGVWPPGAWAIRHLICLVALIINIYGLRVGISTTKKFTSGRGWGMTPQGLSYKANWYSSLPIQWQKSTTLQRVPDTSMHIKIIYISRIFLPKVSRLATFKIMRCLKGCIGLHRNNLTKTRKKMVIIGPWPVPHLRQAC